MHVFAYILTWDVRKVAKVKAMTIESFRLQFLKIGILVKEKSKQFSLHLASEFAWRDQFQIAWLKI